MSKASEWADDYRGHDRQRPVHFSVTRAMLAKVGDYGSLEVVSPTIDKADALGFACWILATFGGDTVIARLDEVGR